MGEIDDFAVIAARHVPVVAARIPRTPAALVAGLPGDPEVVDVAGGLRHAGGLLAERLLGALELHLDDLPGAAPGLVEDLRPVEHATFTTLSGGATSETQGALTVLDATHPGATARVHDLVRRLTHHPALAEVLGVPPGTPAAPVGPPAAETTRTVQAAHAALAGHRLRHLPGRGTPAGRAVHPSDAAEDPAHRAALEANLRAARARSAAATPQPVHPRPRAIRYAQPSPPIADTPETRAETAAAARHAAPHLALAVITAHAVLHHLGVATPAAVVGTALGVTARLLPALPPPADHTEAVLARRRAEYLFPRYASGHARVHDGHFTLAEGPTPGNVDFSANGLVAVVDNGIAVRTTDVAGVPVRLTTTETAPPPPDLEWWDDVVEVSWHARRGDAAIPGVSDTTPPWPGDLRVRVHARGRDGNDTEWYELAAWPAPPAPERVLKTADTTEPPYAAHRWINRSALSEAACVTVVTGSTRDGVLRAFGATAPASRRDVDHGHGTAPWVAVHETDGAVLAVEPDGCRGADRGVLAALSAHGRAASMFWNVNALTGLGFAERGRVVAAFEPWCADDLPADVARLLDDLVGSRHEVARGLTAVARYTGRGITPDDLAAVERADEVHLITGQDRPGR
ncbi:DUF6461 domain-containing protein [Saccharothrix longispora]|uniref:Uncharacterized protein n=1 Tax=Saccharothrix longispora TaxID=33920 RepID=A0ABU1PYH6_9PSEU|nr:DUF6461 domain-containing protein [Saccharothrix longispora]MDR6595680.1 hypothetical protein [Saccharothrix longispora]